jgi:hypothetical protein
MKMKINKRNRETIESSATTTFDSRPQSFSEWKNSVRSSQNLGQRTAEVFSIDKEEIDLCRSTSLAEDPNVLEETLF